MAGLAQVIHEQAIDHAPPGGIAFVQHALACPCTYRGQRLFRPTRVRPERVGPARAIELGALHIAQDNARNGTAVEFYQHVLQMGFERHAVFKECVQHRRQQLPDVIPEPADGSGRLVHVRVPPPESAHQRCSVRIPVHVLGKQGAGQLGAEFRKSAVDGAMNPSERLIMGSYWFYSLSDSALSVPFLPGGFTLT